MKKSPSNTKFEGSKQNLHLWSDSDKLDSLKGVNYPLISTTNELTQAFYSIQLYPSTVLIATFGQLLVKGKKLFGYFYRETIQKKN